MTKTDELPDEMTLEDYLNWYTQNRKATQRTGKREAGTDWGQVLINQIAAANLPAPVREHTFHPKRKWRFDLAWVKERIALEIDGGLYARPVVCNHCHQNVKRLVGGKWVAVREGGRHTTGRGRENDIEKENEAQLLGWHIFHVTPDQVQKMEALALLMRIFP